MTDYGFTHNSDITRCHSAVTGLFC